MPGFLLHLGASVQCAHAGQAMPVVSNPRVSVMGQPIVMQSSLYTIVACPFNTGGSPSPCLTAQWVTAALRVTSNGIPVLLMDSQAICTPNATPLLITATQARVTGI